MSSLCAYRKGEKETPLCVPLAESVLTSITILLILHCYFILHMSVPLTKVIQYFWVPRT